MPSRGSRTTDSLAVFFILVKKKKKPSNMAKKKPDVAPVLGSIKLWICLQLCFGTCTHTNSPKSDPSWKNSLMEPTSEMLLQVCVAAEV